MILVNICEAFRRVLAHSRPYVSICYDRCECLTQTGSGENYCLLSAFHEPGSVLKHFTYIISFNPSNNPVR